MDKQETLVTLRLLSSGLLSPVWLAGGLATDFHVGRWTRDHGDIDLAALEENRTTLATEFTDLGFTMTDDQGWITRWTRHRRDVGEVSLAFLQRADANTGNLVIRPEDADDQLVPGIYPGVSGNLYPERYRTLEGIRFRVMSAEDEWVFAKGYRSLRPAARKSESVEHNLALLETILSEDDRERLRPLIGQRLSG